MRIGPFLNEKKATFIALKLSESGNNQYPLFGQ